MMYTKGVLMHTTIKKNGCGKAYTQNYSVFSVVFIVQGCISLGRLFGLLIVPQISTWVNKSLALSGSIQSHGVKLLFNLSEVRHTR